ncbi:aBC transporter ATP-binding protein [Clostridium sp. CAG:1193]|jgi:Fe-S cluster assembly ATP-binding protein|nr:aBC transporter ATP-binding protein [Clostridium sp. CAG:1193]
MLKIENLNVSVSDKKILNDFNLLINDGEIHAIMGPNGTGKSTLSKVIMRDEEYRVLSGNITFDNNDILKMSTDEVARLGIFLAMQYPISIEGVSNADMLRTSLSIKNKSMINLYKFITELEGYYEKLNFDKSKIHSSVNEGLSGGERKKNEIIGMNMLKPKFIILDEIDSGVDVDNLKVIAESIKKYQEESKASLLIITHYPHILNYIKPDYVHIMNNGSIVKTGDYSLALSIEKNGYEASIMKEESICE